MMKVPLVRGRWFTERDSSNSQPVVLVSESMARRYWPGEDPVGKRVRVVPSEAGAPWLTVVGVVGDVVQPRLGDDIEETWYVPYAQSLEPGTSWTVMEIYLAVRTAIDPAVAVDSVKRAIWQVDKTLPVYDVISGASFYAETISPKRVSTILGVCFSALGLFMAVLGIYGVASYAVSQRTHEIGIRMALGAQPGHILRWILRQGILLVLLGVVIGLAGAVALTRFMSSLLSEVEATDPVTFAGVAFLLAAVALLACYIPARRATKVDPMVALRYE
jgi:putative ABC transport system permease protein